MIQKYSFRLHAKKHFFLGSVLLTLVLMHVSSLHVAVADTVFFENGKTLNGILQRATGDLLEFKQPGLFGESSTIQRSQLQSRTDVLQLKKGIDYIGEIIYMDFFNIDIKTDMGITRVRRFDLQNIMIGSDASRIESRVSRASRTHPGHTHSGAPQRGRLEQNTPVAYPYN